MVNLKRNLGLVEIVFYGVGVILGAGIYALIGQGAGLAGNSLWMAFVIGALVASFTGLSYAELSSLFPKAGNNTVHGCSDIFRSGDLQCCSEKVHRVILPIFYPIQYISCLKEKS